MYTSTHILIRSRDEKGPCWGKVTFCCLLAVEEPTSTSLRHGQKGVGDLPSYSPGCCNLKDHQDQRNPCVQDQEWENWKDAVFDQDLLLGEGNRDSRTEYLEERLCYWPTLLVTAPWNLNKGAGGENCYHGDVSKMPSDYLSKETFPNPVDPARRGSTRLVKKYFEKSFW